MQKKKTAQWVGSTLILICITIETVIAFMLHRKMVFIMDDLWYSTNLATGEGLKSIRDVWESQVWHFFNWGGRNITHALLQFIILGGELFADILNLLMTFVLAYLICEIAGRKEWLYYGMAYAMIVSMNANVRLNVFWQSGSANYLYSTSWILLFLLVYLRQVKNPESRKLPGVTFWIVPLGLISGWSTENMGPASFCLTVMVMFYLAKWLKQKAPLWMWLGSLSSLAGSMLVICAPGNFVRSSLIENAGILSTIWQRVTMMLAVTTNFMFTAFLFLLLSMFLYLKAGNKLQPFQILLILMEVLACGAVILSPTFPNRATFGIMILCVVLILSFLKGIEEKRPDSRKYIFCYYIFTWSFAVFYLLVELQAPLM